MEQWAGFENNDFSGNRSRHRKHMDSAGGNGSRPSEQLFVQEEGGRGWGGRLVRTDKGVSLDLQRKAGSRLETLKGASCIGMRCRGRVENEPSLKRGQSKEKKRRRRGERERAREHLGRHTSITSQPPQLQELTDDCSCDRPGRTKEAAGGRRVGSRDANQGIGE